MTTQNHKNKNICQRANRYGANYRDFVRGYLVNAPNTTELAIIGAIAANEMSVTMSPNNETIKIATRKVREKWARGQWPNKQTRPQNLDPKFHQVFEAGIVNLLESYQDEFYDFLAGHTDLLRRDDIPTSHRELLRNLDYFMCDVTDHTRY